MTHTSFAEDQTLPNGTTSSVQTPAKHGNSTPVPCVWRYLEGPPPPRGPVPTSGGEDGQRHGSRPVSAAPSILTTRCMHRVARHGCPSDRGWQRTPFQGGLSTTWRRRAPLTWIPRARLRSRGLARVGPARSPARFPRRPKDGLPTLAVVLPLRRCSCRRRCSAVQCRSSPRPLRFPQRGISFRADRESRCPWGGGRPPNPLVLFWGQEFPCWPSMPKECLVAECHEPRPPPAWVGVHRPPHPSLPGPQVCPAIGFPPHPAGLWPAFTQAFRAVASPLELTLVFRLVDENNSGTVTYGAQPRHWPAVLNNAKPEVGWMSTFF